MMRWAVGILLKEVSDHQNCKDLISVVCVAYYNVDEGTAFSLAEISLLSWLSNSACLLRSTVGAGCAVGISVFSHEHLPTLLMQVYPFLRLAARGGISKLSLATVAYFQHQFSPAGRRQVLDFVHTWPASNSTALLLDKFPSAIPACESEP